MTSVGIVANPASGKDIRRLVSHATTIDNYEKVNIIERVILGAQQCGVDKIYIMPDTFNMGYKAIDKLEMSKELKVNVEVLNMRIHANTQDTADATKMMVEKHVGCMVVLGGDGTNRAAAKSIKHTPLIGISTGTNNVYPQMIEGTVAGIAAGVVASGKYERHQLCNRDKWIEIYLNDDFVDIALIDAVISKNLFVGAKAMWDIEDIVKVFVSRCHPASLGFSSVLGMKLIIRCEDEFGAYADINGDYCEIMAPMAAGVVVPICIGKPKKLNMGEDYVYDAAFNGIVAVDGERELVFSKGDRLAFRITREGPYHVDIEKTLEAAQQDGFFERPVKHS